MAESISGIIVSRNGGGIVIQQTGGPPGPAGPPGAATIADVSGLVAALAAKQDAATAATDTELGDEATARATGDSARQLLSEKAQANGYASLNASGKVPPAQLAISGLSYQGIWDANTNTPTLADGTGTSGRFYIVGIAGSQDLGSGSIDFEVGDWVLHDGSVWGQVPAAAPVNSVFGRTGVVTPQADDYNIAKITGLQTALDGKQSLDTDLTTLAGLASLANLTSLANLSGTGGEKGLYFSAAGVLSTFSLSAFMRAAGLLGAADVTASKASLVTLGLGTSGFLNVPASGDAASGEVVKGSDSRLVGALPINPYTVPHTFGAADLDALAKFASASDLVSTVPAASTYAWPTGRSAYIKRDGPGALAVVPAPGVTIHFEGGKVTGKYLDDAFTAANGTNLVGRTPTGVGPAWANASGATSGGKIQTNRAYGDASSRRLVIPTVPESADYDVEAVVYCVTDTGAGNRTGVLGRQDPSATTYYAAGWDLGSNTVELVKRVSPGADASIGSYADAPVAGQQRTIRLRLRGTQLSVYVDGVLRIGPVTDSGITAAGRIGATLVSATTTTGCHLDSIVAAPDLDYLTAPTLVNVNSGAELLCLGPNEFWLLGGVV